MIRSVISTISRRSASTLSATSAASPTSTSAASNLSISNIPARWKNINKVERELLTEKLMEAQKADWKQLSLEEKKSLYFIAFGPHGPRETLPPGFHTKVALTSAAVVAASGALFLWIRSKGEEKPATLSKEWQEASNEYAKENKMNPITGISSDGYKGKGFVQ